MMNESHCPDVPALERFLLGKSSGQEAATLEQHLQDCEKCLAVLQTLPMNDSMVDALQAGSNKAEATGPEGVQLLAAWLKKMRPDFDPRAAKSLGLLVPEPGKETTEVYGKTSQEDDTPDYEFLNRSQNPGKLGRLGQYQIRRVLGTGGMGIVFEAFDPGLDRLVALKTMLPALAEKPSAKLRFLREAKAAARIKHDHIVNIYQVGEDRGVCFLAMEYLQGESLERRLARESILALADTLRISRECAEALAAAHAQGLIHRDIKPANIWLEVRDEGTEGARNEGRGASADPDPRLPLVAPPPLAPRPSSLAPRVKILDFGLALPASDNAHLTQSGAVVGTPAYMAPEQLRGQPIDARADLFSLGCVLYRMATGQAPFKGTHAVSTLIAVATINPVPPQQLNPRLPTALCDLITQLLAKAPEARPESALAVVKAIRAIEQMATTTDPASSSDAPTVSALLVAAPGHRAPTATRQRMSRMFLGVAAALLVGLLAFSAYWSWPRDDWSWPPDETGERRAPADPSDEGQAIDASPFPVELRKFEEEKSPPWALVLSRDGSRALSGHRSSGKVILWDVVTGAILKTMKNGHRDVEAVAFGPDGSWAISGGTDKVVRTWDLKTGEEHSQFKLVASVSKLVLFRDGKRALVGSSTRMRVLALQPYKTMKLDSSDSKIGPLSVALSPDEKFALSGGVSATIGLWNVETGTFVRAFKPGHTSAIRWLAFAPDGTRVVSASKDGTCCVWDVASGEVKQVFDRHGDPVQNAVFFPDGQHVVSIGADKFARIWDSRTANEIHAIALPAKGRTLALSADGRLLLTGCGDFGTFAEGDDFRIRAWRLPPMPTDAPGIQRPDPAK
jgi:eukaryotic-like serine/threonine-protein kinase